MAKTVQTEITYVSNGGIVVRLLHPVNNQFIEIFRIDSESTWKRSYHDFTGEEHTNDASLEDTLHLLSEAYKKLGLIKIESPTG